MTQTKSNEMIKVWLGDPCYAIRDEEWSDFVDMLTKLPYSQGIDIEWKGVKMFVMSTEHGDGEYDVRCGWRVVGSVGVDAGLLCVMPLEAVSDYALALGFVAEVSPYERASGSNYELKIGDYSIPTSWDNSYNEDDSEDWCPNGDDEEDED